MKRFFLLVILSRSPRAKRRGSEESQGGEVINPAIKVEVGIPVYPLSPEGSTRREGRQPLSYKIPNFHFIFYFLFVVLIFEI
jgi:hypothetical protein